MREVTSPPRTEQRMLAATRLMCYDRIEEFPHDSWARLSDGGTLFSTRDWLRMREGELPAHGSARYFVSLAAGKPVAAACGYAFDKAPHPLYDPAEMLAGAIDDDTLRQLAASPVVIGAGWSEFRGEFLIAGAISREARSRIIQSLARSVADWAEQQRAPYLAFYYLPIDDAAAVIEAFGTRHATIVFHDVEAIVRPEWPSFGAYIDDLPGRRRRNARRELRVFRESGRKIRELDLATAIPLVAPLNSALMNKYGHAYTPERARAVFERQAALLNHRSSVLLVEDEEGPTGFSLRYRHAEDMYSRVAGFDYSRPSFDYFALRYEAIRRLIDSGTGVLHLGQGAMEAKLARGATPRPLYNVLVTPKTSAAAMTIAARELSRHRLEVLAARFGTEGSRGIRVEHWLPEV